MRKITFFFASLLLSVLFCYNPVQAQGIKLTGSVSHANDGEKLPSVSVKLSGTTQGTTTNDKGEFIIQVPHLPVTLIFSSVGFETQNITVTSNQNITVQLVPGEILGEEVTVSASRVAERSIESPVTLERLSAAAIKNSVSTNYYDLLSSLKGVDVTTSSITFKTPTTRGFSGSGSARVNQIMSGMDNQAPGLNFSVGSVSGLTELDVESMELIPGASSALYGPGGMNGTIIVNGKNPFKYQGLSVLAKAGVMNVDSKFRQASAYHNWSIRYAKKLSDKFAFKIASEVISAKDWLGYDTRNYRRNGTSGRVITGDRATDPNYDGVNVYGDETTADIRSAVLNTVKGSAPFLANFIDSLNGGAPINVSRTGYSEKDVVSPNALNIKVSGSVNYMVAPKTELSLSGFWATGNSIYTGSERYSLKNLKIGQYKLELMNPEWFLRAYTTQEDAGNSYNATVTTRLFNEAWKPSAVAGGWYQTYALAYLDARLNGQNDLNAHTAARALADVGRPVAGAAEFKRIFDEVAQKPIKNGGGRFIDKTDLYMVEGQYNLSRFTGNFADVLVGGNFKKYILNSEGTLFADSTGTIGINEIGAYAQVSKSLAERVKLIFSGRYDKNQNFKGKFTPRIAAVIKLKENNNLRLSYQTAYRFPTTQQQWINLNVGSNTTLIGGHKSFRSFYNLTGTTYLYANDPATGKESVITTPYSFVDSKPESVTSFEIGYKGLAMQNKLLIDVYGYLGKYQDFITRSLLAKPMPGRTIQDLTNAIANKTVISNVAQIYSVPTNAPGKLTTYGWGVGLDYKIFNNLLARFNVSSDVLSDAPAGFITSFNAPKYRITGGITNTGFGKKNQWGYALAARWQEKFFYNSDFVNDDVPRIFTMDAYISYKLPVAKTIVKLGATNMFNDYYRDSPGNSIIGGLYFISFGYNL